MQEKPLQHAGSETHANQHAGSRERDVRYTLHCFFYPEKGISLCIFIIRWGFFVFVFSSSSVSLYFWLTGGGVGDCVNMSH